MKKCLFTTLLSGAIFAAPAQTASPETFLTRLAEPAPARVEVTMSGALDGLLNRPESFHGKSVEGYRVYIFRDNSQFGRDKARGVLARFRSEFPDIAGDTLIYRNPDWMVAVGNCLSREEAVIVFGRVKGVFENTVIRQENIPLRNFLQATLLPIEPNKNEGEEAVEEIIDR